MKGLDDGLDLLVGHGLMAGDGEFLLADKLCDGQFERIPLPIATLAVGRNRVMNLRLDAFFDEETLQFVAARAENGEDMIDAVTFGANDAHKGIADFAFVAGGNLFSSLVIGIEVAQLDIEYGGLKLVDARVTALVVMHVFLVTAVVAQGTNDLSQLSNVGGDGTSITQCAEVLAWIEAVGGCVAKGASLFER